MRICRVPGCGKQTDGYSVYCSQHRRRQRRHGSAQQATISVTRLKPHRDAIKRWLEGRPEENGWEPLRTLFRHLVEHSQTELELARTGASPRYLRQAHEDVLKVANEGPAVVDQAILTVAAMYRLQAEDRLAFVSDDGFRVQLARRFRAHTDLNVAVTLERGRRTQQAGLSGRLKSSSRLPSGNCSPRRSAACRWPSWRQWIRRAAGRPRSGRQPSPLSWNRQVRRPLQRVPDGLPEGHLASGEDEAAD